MTSYARPLFSGGRAFFRRPLLFRRTVLLRPPFPGFPRGTRRRFPAPGIVRPPCGRFFISGRVPFAPRGHSKRIPTIRLLRKARRPGEDGAGGGRAGRASRFSALRDRHADASPAVRLPKDRRPTGFPPGGRLFLRFFIAVCYFFRPRLSLSAIYDLFYSIFLYLFLRILLG